MPKQNAPPTNDTPAKGCRNEHAGQHRDDGKPCEPALCQVTASPGALASAGTPLVKQGTPLIKCMQEAHMARRPGGRVGQGNHGKKAAFVAGLRGIEMALLGTISFYPTSSNRIVGPAARRAPRAGEAVVNVLADTQHATRRGAARHAARERGTVRSPVDTRPTERPAGAQYAVTF